MEFEWDAEKASENLRKHKIRFSEAAETFSDPDEFVLTDEKHSLSEERLYWVGKSTSGKILMTRFTRRGGKIRIIGAAEWREFRKLYNEKTKPQKS
jgi:uncharacterized protein